MLEFLCAKLVSINMVAVQLRALPKQKLCNFPVFNIVVPVLFESFTERKTLQLPKSSTL
jgi:hypothetical protein